MKLSKLELMELNSFRVTVLSRIVALEAGMSRLSVFSSTA